MTEFSVLSHASCMIKTDQATVIVDPWLIGSCYWRSWWNYPPVKSDVKKNLDVDAIYITHVHWDHWHGPSLKKLFSPETLIITHDEPHKRSVNDLKSIGFKNLKILKHGQSFQVEDIRLSAYQFGLFLNDSALVVETRDTKIFNANDCKIAGNSLRDIITRHGPFDFALRSHSSANDRVCYRLKSDVNYQNDDAEHYSRSFAYFMNVVKPKYAVPFASNHCHLHKDVYTQNAIINDPFKLQAYIDNKGLMPDVKMKIMLSGDKWNSDTGFSIDPEGEAFFKNKDEHLKQYARNVSEQLEKYYQLESRTRIREKDLKRFSEQIKAIPVFLRKRFKGFSYKLTLTSEIGKSEYVVYPAEGRIETYTSDYDHPSEVIIPAKIFVDSVRMNMFHHSSISKRNLYLFDKKEDLEAYQNFHKLLGYVELGVFPLRFSYISDLIFGYLRRWRELIVYFQAFSLKRRGLPLYKVEEEILKKT